MNWARDAGDWPHRGASRFVRAGGLLWHVQRFGEGPPILLLHGTGSASMSWRGVAPMLARRFTVVIPDLPGHGFTEAPPSASMSLPGQARLLTALLAALGVRPVLAVGHSAGAAIAARLVLDGAITPASLLSINGALVPLAGHSAQMFPIAARVLAATGLAPRVFALHATNRSWLDRFLENTGSTIDDTGRRLYGMLLRDPVHVGSALRMMSRWQLEPLAAALPSLPCALHLAVGDADRMVPPADAETIAASVPGARLHVFGGLGHLAHEERPDLAASLADAIATGAETLAVAC